MCGINGFTFADNDLIARMNTRVAHRGPDDHGSFVEDGISLGHQRLSIIDLSPAGHQPMMSEDEKIILVFNGEIYNFEEIRETLQKKGHHFRSKSDSEVIIAAYREYGEACLSFFNGIFAFAIWDRKEKQLLVARDRIGVKPLYYYVETAQDGSERLIFSSEIKAILEHDVPRKLNIDALNIYLRMLYVPGPLTMFAGISKLLPGHKLVYKDGRATVAPYWQPSFTPLLSRDEAIPQIRTLIDDAVQTQLTSDRPVGVFLSGGIDSTLITGLAKKHLGDRINTFSVRYDVDSEKFNADAALAKRISAHFGTTHHELTVTGKNCADHLVDVIFHMDEPVANATQVATYLLSKFAKPEATVVLGGDGGDELFGGYERYRLSRHISTFQSIPGARSLLQCLVPMLPQDGVWKKMLLSPGVDRYLGFMAQKELDIAQILRPEIYDSRATRTAYERYFFKEDRRDPESQLMWADIQSWLPDESLLRSDKMSMAFGVEQRVPFLDHRLVELSLRIPTALKIRGKNKKAILKEAMGEYLPDFVIQQPKRGWFSPTSVWMRTALQDMVREVISPSYNPDLKNVFDFAAIDDMYSDHVNTKVYQMNLLWAITTFQVWYHQFFTQKRV